MATSGEAKDGTLVPDRRRRWSDGRGPDIVLSRWRGLGLSLQFLLIAAGAMILLSALAGALQARLIRASLIESNARTASIYMRAIIAPHVQELAITPTLSSTSREALERSLQDSGLWAEINVVTVWRPDGMVLYSSDKTMIGRQFRSLHVEEAALGRVVVSQDEPDHEAPAIADEGLFEIYIPIAGPSGEILAVGEFYQDMRTARAGLTSIVRGSWFIRLASVGAGVFVLFLLVRNAHGIILRQQTRLKRLYDLAKRRAAENYRLRSEADDARRRAALSNENLLSRLGSELHDGPLQLLSLAMLLSGENKSAATPSDQITTRPPNYSSLTADAIAQLREISAA